VAWEKTVQREVMGMLDLQEIMDPKDLVDSWDHLVLLEKLDQLGLRDQLAPEVVLDLLVWLDYPELLVNQVHLEPRENPEPLVLEENVVSRENVERLEQMD